MATKVTSIRNRVERLEKVRGGTCFMVLAGEYALPENVKKLKKTILARGQIPQFLCLHISGPPEISDGEQ